MNRSSVNKTAGHTFHSTTRSLCPTCLQTIDALILFRGNDVYLEKFCPAHGKQEVVVSSSVDWFLDCLTFRAPSTPPQDMVCDPVHGCPHDCGPCASHNQRVFLPVIPITSACNLDCPICYTINKNENAYLMKKEELHQILSHIDDGYKDIINFTGGEPTLHPEMIELLRHCRKVGFERLTVSTNGLVLKDETYVEMLAALDARIILSIDSFRAEIDKELLGANTVKTKLEVLDSLERHGITATILPAIAAGLNDNEVGDLLNLVLEHPNIVSLELHTMCFTGQGGVDFGRQARITVPDLHRRIAESTAEQVTARDFVPSPLAHPHCYSICYLLVLDGGGFIPFTRLLPRSRLFELLKDSLYIEPGEKLEVAFREIIDRLWADPNELPQGAAVLKTLKRLLQEMFPPGGPALSMSEQRRIAERSSKAIYIHSHMDAENFDVARIMNCCVAVPEPDGGFIPTCSYNVLYRRKDERFASPVRSQNIEMDRHIQGINN